MVSFPLIDGERQPLIGAYVPQCNEDGSYKEVQCHGSTGYCWCVNDKGVKREETEIRFKTPNCSKGNLLNWLKSINAQFLIAQFIFATCYY